MCTSLSWAAEPAQQLLYPLPLLNAILQGMSETEHVSQCVPNTAKDEYDVALVMSPSGANDGAVSSTFELEPGSLPKQDGSSVKLAYALRDFKPVYLDAYTREELPDALVCQAIKEELDYFNAHV